VLRVLLLGLLLLGLLLLLVSTLVVALLIGRTNAVRIRVTGRRTSAALGLEGLLCVARLRNVATSGLTIGGLWILPLAIMFWAWSVWQWLLGEVKLTFLGKHLERRARNL
jgi:hypothetical protein